MDEFDVEPCVDLLVPLLSFPSFLLSDVVFVSNETSPHIFEKSSTGLLVFSTDKYLNITV